MVMPAALVSPSPTEPENDNSTTAQESIEPVESSKEECNVKPRPLVAAAASGSQLAKGKRSLDHCASPEEVESPSCVNCLWGGKHPSCSKRRRLNREMSLSRFQYLFTLCPELQRFHHIFFDTSDVWADESMLEDTRREIEEALEIVKERIEALESQPFDDDDD